MSTTQWMMSVIVALIGGGAMGAVITALVTRYRNRRQPIGYTKEIIEVFKENAAIPSLRATLMLGEGFEGTGAGVRVENLSIARFTVVNKSNQDMEQFKFGITLTGTNNAVEVKWETLDRHHELEVLTDVSIGEPKKELDFKLEPFNRGEEYNFNVYFTYIDEPGLIKLSSRHSTRFVELSKSESSIPEPSAKEFAKGMIRILLIITSLLLFSVLASLIYISIEGGILKR